MFKKRKRVFTLLVGIFLCLGLCSCIATSEGKKEENLPTLIIGSDNWLIFDSWRAFDEIIADFGVVIYPRPGFPLPPDKTLPDNVEIVKAPEIELSSTHIRHCAKKGLDLHFLLPDKVREYIMFNNLYKD